METCSNAQPVGIHEHTADYHWPLELVSVILFVKYEADILMRPQFGMNCDRGAVFRLARNI